MNLETLCPTRNARRGCNIPLQNATGRRMLHDSGNRFGALARQRECVTLRGEITSYWGGRVRSRSPLGMPAMPVSKRRGFTTIELIIVLVVFGIVAALAGPKFYDAFIAAQTRTAADRFVRATELARASAVRFGRDAEVHIDASGKRFWVTVDTSVNLTGQKDTIGPIQSLVDAKVTITANPAADTLICFDIRGIRSSRGLCQTGGLAVLFSYTGRVDSVQITSLGKVLR